MRGETVVVRRPTAGGADPFGAPVVVWVEDVVEDVLVAPGPRNDADGAIRPDGKIIAWNLHFPKTFDRSLKGCEVRVRGQDPAPVIGDPQPYSLENTPTRWWMPVELGRVDG